MRVLDIGSGAGDVAFEAARLVGPCGAVFGIDKSEEAVAAANRLAAAEGLTWCKFAVADVESYLGDEPFDAMVGRLVLMHLPDPAGALRKLAHNLRPGGVVALQEFHLSAMAAFPDGPLYTQCKEWIVTAFGHVKTEFDMGPKLFATFREAGLPDPEMEGKLQFTSGPDSPVYEVLASAIRSLLPALEQFGIATTQEIGIDTLEQRLREEVVGGGRVCLIPPMIGAWSRIPG
jgi:SAM-dependent methyltransferase